MRFAFWSSEKKQTLAKFGISSKDAINISVELLPQTAIRKQSSLEGAVDRADRKLLRRQYYLFATTYGPRLEENLGIAPAKRVAKRCPT